MKRLYLLRHAETASAYGHSDIERKLTQRGHTQAERLGQTMAAKHYVPDLTYCSPAARTQQTLSGITKTLDASISGALKTETITLLYGAAPGDMLNLIQSTTDEAQSLLIVAHNPTIHYMSGMLADERSVHYDAVTMSYAPGTLSVFDCEIETWSDIQPAGNPLVDLILPASV